MAELNNKIDHSKYYNSHPSGVECINVARHYNFNIGCVIKYLWRCGLKSEPGMADDRKALEDLEKAKWYLEDEIKYRKQKLGL